MAGSRSALTMGDFLWAEPLSPLSAFPAEVEGEGGMRPISAMRPARQTDANREFKSHVIPNGNGSCSLCSPSRLLGGASRRLSVRSTTHSIQKTEAQSASMISGLPNEKPRLQGEPHAGIVLGRRIDGARRCAADRILPPASQGTIPRWRATDDERGPQDASQARF